MATSAGSHGSSGKLPPIAALFLVVFDRKVGYSIAWKRALPDLELERVVEYKSLPSGLHNVQSDLVYFVHEQYAGISAFANHPAAEADRNASFATVGILVPLTYGRLGRSWLHAEQLRHLAETVVGDTDDTAALQDYWDQHCISPSEARKTAESSSATHDRSSQDRRKRRTLSDAPEFRLDEHTLSRDHPAMSLAQDLEAFGPLIFPLYRAALLKKRILIMSGAPVQPACNFVYNLSVLSNIPPPAANVTRTPGSRHPIKPLFSIGIHDIAHLSELSKSDPQGAWLACTTDDIMATKTALYDVLVELTPPGAHKPGNKQWPKIKTSDGQAIKATQRDLRRYYALRHELHRKQRPSQHYRDEEDEQATTDDNSESAPLTRTKSGGSYAQDDFVSLEGEGDLAEPSSWASIAYSSFLWWASAGERDALLDDEALQDSRLLDDLPIPHPGRSSTGSRPSSRSGGKRPSANGEGQGESEGDGPDEESQSVAVVLIAYAHRLTTLIIETLAEIIDAAEDESEDGEETHPILIQNEDIRRMGLDEWSQADGEFVKEMVTLYFGREADVQGRFVQCCGVKIF